MEYRNRVDLKKASKWEESGLLKLTNYKNYEKSNFSNWTMNGEATSLFCIGEKNAETVRFLNKPARGCVV